MLFLLKRRWQSAILGLTFLTVLGMAIRCYLPEAPTLGFSLPAVGLGVFVFLGVLLCDGILHGLLGLLFGQAYRERYQKLASLFQGQRPIAIVTGALMAGIGEELVFRGLSIDLIVLTGLAVPFGLLHHVRASLWPFTLWAVLQGWLFALALHWTGLLAVTMTAHFLHDLTGFLIFRWLNARSAPA